MVRDTSERRQQITEMVRQNGSVQVAPLSEQFGVSTQTIRKDLQFLVDKGIALRSYGGAISSSDTLVLDEEPVDQKRGRKALEKQRIGKLAASMVNRGEAIILDSGTTTAQIARHLPDTDDITVITNDFTVLSVLSEKSKLEVVALGGSLRRKNQAFYGSLTQQAIERLRAGKLFLGVDGFDISSGITTHHEYEAQLNREMIKIASQTIAVTDSSKFNRMCLHRIVDIGGIDILVTDDGIPQDIVDECEQLSIEVHIA